MAIKYGIIGGLAMLAEQVTALSWQFDNKALVKEAMPSASNPNITSMEPKFFKDIAKKVSVKYGPHSVPGMAAGAAGMAGTTVLDRNATKPCEDCVITWMQANLVYPDGKVANTDTGMWLHHAVALNRARKDTVCAKTAIPIQRFFASGNERTEINLSMNGTSKTGYFVGKKDHFMMLMEFMNDSPDARDAIMTIDYEFVPMAAAKEQKFERVDTMWLDVGGCTGSDQAVKSNATSEYEMETPFETRRAGRVLGLGSHMHDGGIHVEVKQNDKQICDSVAEYGQTPAYVSSMPMPEMPGMPAGDMKMQHVSSISSCYNKDATYKMGDKFSVKAFYDMEKHPGMKEMDGKLAPVMGISVVYTVPEARNRTTMPGATGGMEPGMKGDAVRAVSSWMTVGIVGLFAALAGLMV